MYYMDARCVIFNLLRIKKSFHPSILLKYFKMVKKKEHEAYMDITSAGLYSFAENYSDIIAIIENRKDEEDQIRVRGDVTFDYIGKLFDKDFLNKTINRKFPVRVRKVITDCAEKVFE